MPESRPEAAVDSAARSRSTLIGCQVHVEIKEIVVVVSPRGDLVSTVIGPTRSMTSIVYIDYCSCITPGIIDVSVASRGWR